MDDTGTTITDSKGEERKVFSVTLGQGDYPNGGFYRLIFQYLDGNTWKGQFLAFGGKGESNKNWTTIDKLAGKIFDATTSKFDNGSLTVVDNPYNESQWTRVEYYYAGMPLYFKNASGTTLDGVTATFYKKGENNTFEKTGSQTIGTVAANTMADQKITIPNNQSQFVKFSWAGYESERYYNFSKDNYGDTEYFDLTANNCFVYSGNGSTESPWQNAGGDLLTKDKTIYFDATLSSYGYDGEGLQQSPMPHKGGAMYCFFVAEDGNLTKVDMVQDPTQENSKRQLWSCKVPGGSFTAVQFSARQDADGKSAVDDLTKQYSTAEIPPNLKAPCFFADDGDPTAYTGRNGDITQNWVFRDGYWGEKDAVRNAESGKGTTVVDIANGTFTQEAGTKYITSTLYDYYTDYELNGFNRDSYPDNNTISQRGYVTFEQFNRALSSAYEKDGHVQYPIYTGHFQPSYNDWSCPFAGVATGMGLYGWGDPIKEKEKYNTFMAVNNSVLNTKGEVANDEAGYARTFQGLVEDKTSTSNANGLPVLKGTESLVDPHFDKEFLEGKNTFNTVLGKVYENVSFPFTKGAVFKKPDDATDKETNAEYWYYDSSKSSLYLTQDNGKFYLESTKNQKGELTTDIKSENRKYNNDTNGTCGFFPFNKSVGNGGASQYNYGFGAKLQFDFTLTNDGMVQVGNDANDKVPIKFFFSGDDDVWVYIDGQLVLDVGGAHGKASGLLEFGDNGTANTVTPYVSSNKTGGDVYKDYKDSGNVKSVYFNGKQVTFDKKGNILNKDGSPFTLTKGTTHTLTMFYMERGMWESNMAVAFNFPDNNELQVQKIVDTTDVNDWFKSCFDTPDLFAFNIKNQATHYQNPKQDATIDSDVNLIKLNNSDYASCKPATENSKGNIFKLTTAPTGEEALHWYGQYQDTNPPSECRSERYGILTLRDAIDISQKRYLTFDIYAKSESGQGVLSLGNLYLELLDKNGKQKGCLDKTCLNGTTYGTVTLANDQWITVKLDLYKLNAEEGFDPEQVTMIRVGDNYPRHIYFKDFVFSAQAKATTKTGFTTKQEDIPVYGSIDAKGLKNAAGAQFTTTKNNDTQVVDKNGQFMLQNGETVTFSDQFRRGSYISLKETLSPNLYDTTWTVFENDEPVQSYGSGSTVTGETKNLKEQPATESQPGPDDGRTEVYNPAPDIANNGYTANQKPENANTIVFRSYKNPDEENTSSLTKLKVQFVNKVKTGKLVIKKAAASDEVNLIKGKYTFNVTFTNVGDESLEQKPIKKQVTINMGTTDHCEISGIPIGTRFRIEEVTPTDDGSHLQGVSVIGGGADTQVVGNTYVQGSISGSGTNVTATFTNTMHELIKIDFTKTWVDANGNPLKDGLPDEIYIQLQRRKMESDKWQTVRYPEATSLEYVKVTPNSKGWDYPFANLDKFDVKDHTNYQYRIVEGTVDDKGNFTEVKPNETITINDSTYVVTAKAEAKISDGDSTKDTTATATDGTITGDSGTIVLTNTLQNPKFALNIIKKDAENGENNKEVFLKDVEFKLEKLKAETTEGEPQVDTTYTFTFGNTTSTGSITATTKGDGKITGVFTNLEPGTYRLTETKAHPGYNLLAQPIEIKFTQDGKCYIDDAEVKKDDKTFIPGTNNTYTMNLTVLNRKTPELPHTGADAPSLWLLIGMPLAVAGLLIFTFRYNRKGGRRH